MQLGEAQRQLKIGAILGGGLTAPTRGLSSWPGGADVQSPRQVKRLIAVRTASPVCFPELIEH